MVVVEKKYGFGEPEPMQVGKGWQSKTAWDYPQKRDIKRHGDWITDKKEIGRICNAVFGAGGLPYMWDRAEEFKIVMYEVMNLDKGNKVLIIGEALEACGFMEEVKKRLKGEGEMHCIEIIEEGRTTGRWQYDYPERFPDEYFDAILLPQGVHHNIDWVKGAKDFSRILKKGGRIVFAEATVGLIPDFKRVVEGDVHVEAIMKKVYVGMGYTRERGRDPLTWAESATQTTPKQLKEAFTPYLKDIKTFVWSGMMLVYGTKK